MLVMRGLVTEKPSLDNDPDTFGEAAIAAAVQCEIQQMWLREGVGEPIGELDYDQLMEEGETYLDDYHEALAAIKKQFPTMVCCNQFETGLCMHGKPCECGGMQAPWPWIITHPTGTASRFCGCHLTTRSQWAHHCGPAGDCICPGHITYTSRSGLLKLISEIEAGR